MRCQLCAYEFEPTEMSCHVSCPFNEHCAIICCPNCGYQIVDESKSKVSGALQRFLNRRTKVTHSTRPMCCPLSELHVGDVGKLVSIESKKAERIEHLQIYGLMPGAKVTLKQRLPEFILEVGHTELTVERDIAAEILIERVLRA